MPQTKLYISGMTCTSCETIIRNEIKDLPGLKHIHISCRQGLATLEHDDQLILDQTIDRINNLGYQATTTPVCSINVKKATAKQWLASFLAIAILYLFYRLFNNLGAFSWLDVDPSKINYSVAFLVGIVASMSTCLMVVGAVIISFSAKYQAKGIGFYNTAVKPQVLFQIGRLATFFVLGGLLGLMGSWLKLSDNFIAWFTVIIALVLVWLGLNILGLVPSLTKFGLGLPKSIMKTWDKLQQSERAWAPIILGGLTFFLPCGFTQSMQLFAISTGNFWLGAYTMLLFALGTTPILFGLGVATSKFSNLKSVIFKQTVGLLVVIFALYTFSNGATLLGWHLNLSNNQQVGQVTTSADQQIVEMTIDRNGFSPNQFELQVGVPVKWIINGDQITGCTSEIIVPDLGIKQKIHTGENIVEFTPSKVGNINFSCWMG
ncbi:MAG: sulfite exporter TauE/SafE family protein, partial [bacterium]